MFVVTFRKLKCIGCNYCQEAAPDYFALSKKDGKAVLLRSEHKRGVDVLKVKCGTPPSGLLSAEKACPARIIAVRASKEKK